MFQSKIELNSQNIFKQESMALDILFSSKFFKIILHIKPESSKKTVDNGSYKIKTRVLILKSLIKNFKQVLRVQVKNLSLYS